MPGVLDDDQPARAPQPVTVRSSAPPPDGNGSTPEPARPESPAPTAPAARLKRPRRLRRTWPQRLLVGFNIAVALACLGTAIGLWYGYDNIAGQIKRVNIFRGSDTETALGTARASNGNQVVFGEEVGELNAENFLVVGTDNRKCQSDNPQYAGAFGDEGGDNTDTIMLMRVDPDAKQAAILSFPRDLWVQRPDTNRSDKINALYDPLDPFILAEGIRQNFGLPVDHFLSIDFCGFRDLVDEIGGVRIPFEYPARDRQTGLDIPEPGCWGFNGDAALAYARSRHYQWQDEDGDWHDDNTSDYGRVARQQDFVRRVLRKAVDQGARDPRRLQGLISVALDHVTIDAELTPQDLYDLGRVFRDVDPAAVRSFTIAGDNAQRGNASVQVFDLANPVNADIVQVFSGQATLAPDAPEAAAPAAPDAGAGEAAPLAGAQTDDTTPPTTAAPGAVPEVTVSSTNERNVDSIVPPNDPTCM